MTEVKTIEKKEVTARLRYIRITPRKARLVADTVRGMTLNEAEAQLSMTPKRAGVPILKLIRSAKSNAENNSNIDSSKLYVKSIRVDQGPQRFKKWEFRAQGRANLLSRKTSHITLVLGETEKAEKKKYIFPAKLPKEKKELKKGEKLETKPTSSVRQRTDTAGKEKEAKPKRKHSEPKVEQSSKPSREPGFIKRIFRRKSI